MGAAEVAAPEAEEPPAAAEEAAATGGDAHEFYAVALERVAARLRAGDIPLSGACPADDPAAALATVLAAMLRRDRDGDAAGAAAGTRPAGR